MRAQLFSCLAILLLAGCTATEFVPEPEAGYLLLPTMPQPRLDGKIGAGEWDDAIHFEGEFVIANGSKADGRYPFTAWLGADEQAFHFAVEVRGAGENPFNTENVSKPHTLDVYLNEDTDEIILGADLISTDNRREYGSSMGDGYWTGTEWSFQPENTRGAYNNGTPTGGRWVFGNYVEPDVLVWEHYVARHSSLPDRDMTPLESGKVLRLNLKFIVHDPAANEWMSLAHNDDWPGDGWTPHNHMDPGGWLRIRIP